MTIRFKDWLTGLTALGASDVAPADLSVVYDADAAAMKSLTKEAGSIGGIVYGARAILAADASGVDFSSLAAVTFDSTDYDNGDVPSGGALFHSTSANTERLTLSVPFAGAVVQCFVSLNVSDVTASTVVITNIKRYNESSVLQNRWAIPTIDPNSSSWRVGGHSDPIVGASGDYFQVDLQLSGDASVDLQSEETSFSIVVWGKLAS